MRVPGRGWGLSLFTLFCLSTNIRAWDKQTHVSAWVGWRVKLADSSGRLDRLCEPLGNGWEKELLLQVAGLPWGEEHIMREGALTLCDSVDKAQGGPFAHIVFPSPLPFQVSPEVWERELGEGDEV